MKRLFPLILLAIAPLKAQTQAEKYWLPSVTFSAESFAHPAPQFAPFTRWWLPGNDITPEELKREINLFADNHFGGVEIQPFALVMPTRGKGRADRIMSYDTPAYYENIKQMLAEAQKRNLIVDFTNGSGWPPGGPHIAKEEGNLTLEFGIANLGAQPIALPRASHSDDPTAKLVAVLAGKFLNDTTATDKTFRIDPKTLINITDKVKNNTIQYSAPKGWKAIAFWSVPTQETPMLIAKREAGYVFNHFDSLQVKKNYDYLFGERTGLAPYFGKPVRAIFNDSYEFKANRHFSDDFIRFFKQQRGYDPTPYLPANMWRGYNNMYERMVHPANAPYFSLGADDWRLRYDYDLTLSDLLQKHFLNSSKHWANARNLLHRTQTYGFNMDIMAAAGAASIPEVETMLFSKGSENGYKLITSGAHLYNRPIISCEAAVYFKRAYMTTPHKLKLTFDKLFSSGVNQIIYHGTPYRYFPEGYPKEGWYPFYNSALGIDFSSNINENNPFWKYISQINQYAQRAQYVLRSGKPHADVLIYYPFLNYSEEVANPREVMIAGELKDTEPSLPAENKNVAYNRAIDTEWLKQIMPLIDQLNQLGITWDWINDASLQELSLLHNKRLNIRGNEYQSLILFQLPYIQLKSAENLQKLAKKGANILLIGDVPTQQPNYFNYQKNDIKTQKAMQALAKTIGSHHIKEQAEMLNNWYPSIQLPITYMQPNPALRQQRRKLSEGSYAQFIWNESDSWQEVPIQTEKGLEYAYWLDATDGSIRVAQLEKGAYHYQLPPYSSIFFMASKQMTKMPLSSKVLYNPSVAKAIVTPEKWHIQAGDIKVENTALFDWKTHPQLKYNSAPALYTSQFVINTLNPSKHYFLSLGKVYYAADIVVNGKKVSSEVFMPFITDITPYLRLGSNTLEITITNAAYNDFVGQAEKGEKVFKKLKGSDTMSAGLIGPVQIMEQ